MYFSPKKCSFIFHFPFSLSPFRPFLPVVSDSAGNFTRKKIKNALCYKDNKEKMQKWPKVSKLRKGGHFEFNDKPLDMYIFRIIEASPPFSIVHLA